MNGRHRSGCDCKGSGAKGHHLERRVGVESYEAAKTFRREILLFEFFPLDLPENIALECALAAEESFLRHCHLLAVGNLLFNQMQRADKVCQLKERITLWPNILSKLYGRENRFGKNLMQKICYCGLTTIIVNLDFVKLVHSWYVYADEIYQPIP